MAKLLSVVLLALSVILSSEMTSAQPQQQDPHKVCLLVPPDVEECYRSFQGKPISTTAAQVDCLQKLLWHYTPSREITASDMANVDDMFNSLQSAPGNPEQMARNGSSVLMNSRFGFRSEYRTLTYDQRMRFHNAVNTLYRDGIIGMFARIHSAAFTPHHRGPSFLPWHRIMLAMFEGYLRRVDRSVSLPYLDTTMDNDMDNAVNSVIWSADYLGNGAGPVTTGPFAGWVTDQGNLQRDYGVDGNMFSKAQINAVLSNCRLEEISRPTATAANDFERFHGGVHLFVGGEMGVGETAAWDPVFYLHHAYVDYVWEVFRIRQRNTCRVDPTTDYPRQVNNASHAIDAPILGFPQYIVRDGLSDRWIRDYYDYNPAPTCPVCCPGCARPEPIYCDRRRGVCVAASRRVLPANTNMSRSDAMAMNAQFLDETERSALMQPMVPRNRGRAFESPPNDGRTLATALFDAISSANSRQTRAGPVRDRRPDTIMVDGRRRSPNRLRQVVDGPRRFDGPAPQPRGPNRLRTPW